MFTKYDHEFFKQLKTKFLHFLENNSREIDTQSNTYKLFTKLTAFISNNENKIEEIDNFSLVFHNERYFHEYHRGLLNEQCQILHDVKNKPLVENDLLLVTESLYICIYADIKDLMSTNQDTTVQRSYRKLYLELLRFYEYLSNKTINIISMVNDVINFEVSRIRYHEHSNFSANITQLITNEEFIKDSLSESKKLIETINTIKTTLEEQKNDFNFVGLSDGFSTLRKRKNGELIRQNLIYYTLILVIVGLIISKSYWSALYLQSQRIDSPIFIVITVSTVLALFILLYFFRISLTNIKSIKSQILQIDLRLTLCQFIHNYDADTKELREGMKESFERFESVIFAPIVATEEQIPSTFDGIEQLTGMINLVNKNSK